MRVWDIHPGYLSGQSLLGEHSEIHALYSIITEHKRGYSSHPETKRWNDHLNLLVLRHNLLVREMTIRDFKHLSPLGFAEYIDKEEQCNPVSYIDLPSAQFEILHQKYQAKGQRGRIPLPLYGTEFWAQHKYSVMSRGYQYYKEMQSFMNNRPNLPIIQDNNLIVKIQNFMKIPVSEKALGNVILHLWGYFKNEASPEEKRHLFDLNNFSEKMKLLYDMSIKYQKNYLLHSTIFADIFIMVKRERRKGICSH
ncbi:MAG: DUF1722 domain-containing protein [Atribacterota bacterium]|jgi:uncharacterized protein YbgA (DUF1722 family)|nr:DUF1722 domain-containing protein [Atribacterota bacterium]MDD4895438.1 DUF1722 domain-containing protein [Atribacterota bacterium]MDD5636814.1 DUF1722 domain-containing protein [Atribacterota bacterium]MDX9799357.1 DUF1722 domain-containing protein [Bacteroidales bacterium]